MSTPWSKLGPDFLRDESDPHTGDWSVGQGIDAPDRAVLRGLLKTLAPCSLLDVGCGTGITLDGILREGIDVSYTGVDLTPEFIEACQARHPMTSGGPRFYTHDLYELSPDPPFDVVTARGVLEHLHDPEAALRLMYGACAQLLFVAFFIRPGDPEMEITDDGFIQRRCDDARLREVVGELGATLYAAEYQHAGQDWALWQIWKRFPA